MFSRSFQLVRTSWQVVRADPELLWLPALSAVALAATLAISAVPAVMLMFAGELGAPEWLVSAVVTYLVVSVGLFFQTAMVAAADFRLQGGDPDVPFALRAAWRLLPKILGWAAVVSAVKLLLSRVRDSGPLGAVGAGLVDAAFTFATFLTIPVLVVEHGGPISALKRSTMLLKQTWGENIAGRLGLGLITALAAIPGVAALGAGAVYFFTDRIPLAITFGAFGALWLVLLAAISTLLSAVYQAALYRYAVNGEASGFSEYQLAEAFSPYRQRLFH